MAENSLNISTTIIAMNVSNSFQKPFEYKKTIGWLSLLVFIIGLFGNLATIIILCRKRWRGSSVAVFLIALAVSDIMILLNSSLMTYLLLVLNIHIRNLSDGWCKVNIYFAYSSVMTSAWLLVGVTMERMPNVIFARRGKESWTQNIWTTRLLVIVIWVFFYAINGHFLDLMGKVEYEHFKGFGVCTSLSKDYSKFLTKILPWLDFTLVFAAPIVLIVIGNTVTIYNLRKMPKSSLNTKTTAMSRTALTVTLIIVCVVYVINMAPLTFFYVYASLSPYEAYKSYEHLFYNNFAHTLLNLLSNVNAAVNFFLYILSDANVRTDVKLLLRRVFLCERSDSADIGMEETAPTQAEFKTNESAY